ncbi:MAG TPA: NfeD family protein [Pirellulaceae bacterium]|nr:NfeD family protein [Pirellulaceae bacterium]HMO90786.1 NfeD family protein [Pirellulaceae bacterium]HMP68037.1 NfeD family protein [Pirellulaceae bacterium]
MNIPSPRYLPLFVFAGLVFVSLGAVRAVAQEPGAAPAQADGVDDAKLVNARLIPVRLPITTQSAQQVRDSLEAALQTSRSATSPDAREIVILEFDTRNSKTGQGSDFHACLALAELLTDSRANRIRTIAYIPAPQGLAPGTDQLNSKPISHLKGHAVLVALACNELAMHNDSAIGEAGIDEQVINKTRLVAYEEIALKRRVLPPPLVLSLIDPNLAITRAETTDGFVFVDRNELERLREKGMVSFETISDEGTSPLLTSQQLEDYRLIRNRVTSRRQLANRLRIDASSLEVDPSGGKEWRAIQLHVRDYLDRRAVNWLLRSLHQRVESANLVLVRLDTSNGDAYECIRLAEYLAQLDPSKVRTVAYVPEKAGGPTALVALACDHLLMAKTARIGGDKNQNLKPQAVQDLLRAVKSFANKTEHDWSVLAAFVDPSVQLQRMRNTKTGAVELFSAESLNEMEDRADWTVVGPVPIGDSGMSGDEALQYDIAKMLISDVDQLKAFYQLREEPVALSPTVADQWIEWFARTLASPWVAAWLLFGAMFLLSTEMSSPGIGVPGFLGTLCIVLFFWSQYFDGNAGWLEILLFVTGMAFIAIELLVLPGFGIFGIGGLIMVILSIVLATQTFVIPKSASELNQLPRSLGMVLAALGGCVAAIVVLRKYFPNTPFLRRLMLDPEQDGDSNEERQKKELIVAWDYLLGQSGVAVTPLVPSGKARFSGELVDVISRGKFVDKGESVEVIEAVGNRVVVVSKEQAED